MYEQAHDHEVVYHRSVSLCNALLTFYSESIIASTKREEDK